MNSRNVQSKRTSIQSMNAVTANAGKVDFNGVQNAKTFDGNLESERGRFDRLKEMKDKLFQ